MRILLVDDDQALIDVLSRTLVQQNYAIDVATDGEQGWIYGSTYTYDLFILDWSLPQLDGISLCQRFRQHDINTPIILLTSRHGSQNKIKGLNAGADDYICKPFDVEELTARIRALLRRSSCDLLPVLKWGDLKFDTSSGQVSYQGKIIELTGKEYRLLELFLRHNQTLLSIADIIESLWSSMEYPAEATVRSHIRRLRQKLKLAGLPEDIITTLRGQGYCLKSLPSKRQNNLSVEPPDKQKQHLTALTAIWEKHQPKRQQQLASLSQTLESLKLGQLNPSDRLSAIVIAHSLAGNLGQFGLRQASKIAKDIEQLLQNNLLDNPEEIRQLAAKLADLKAKLHSKVNINQQIAAQLSEQSPLLLLIIYNQSDNLREELISKANKQGFRTKLISTPQAVKIWLKQQQASGKKLPSAVLLEIAWENSAPSAPLTEYLALIAEFSLIIPSVPVIVLADRDRFTDRLQVARHGGKFYLSQPISSSQIMSVCQQAAQNSAWGKKIMIVDDDTELLQVLPTLLQPWGFQLTTLDDPRQFWDVLEAVNPDLLVLDIEMPYLSGIELCKVLRTHPYWCKLPVLFLTVYNDTSISHQAFASGANDLVNKPVKPQQLASRILNRLKY